MLAIDGVSRAYGGVKALRAVSLGVNAGEIVGVIGPNGAGKTTLLNLISGYDRPDAGAITFEARSLVGLTPDRILRHGIGRTFQTARLYMRMSILENVLVGLHTRIAVDWLHALACSPRFQRLERQAVERAEGLLREVGLGHQRDALPSALPYADRRRLELARALAAEPRMILLDEPTAGMGPGESEQMIGWILALKARGVAVVLVTHGMDVVRAACDRLYVLNHGECIATGRPGNVLNDARVITAYLGDEPGHDSTAQG